jgi:hypothetical protein
MGFRWNAVEGQSPAAAAVQLSFHDREFLVFSDHRASPVDLELPKGRFYQTVSVDLATGQLQGGFQPAREGRITVAEPRSVVWIRPVAAADDATGDR